MGLFGFGKKNERAANVNWHELDEISQLEKIKVASFDKPIILFKHSTRCGVSSMVLRKLEQNWPVEEDVAKAYFLDLLRHRDISNKIEEEFGVTHQSPQVLIIKKGECTFNASHSYIEPQSIKKEL